MAIEVSLEPRQAGRDGPSKREAVQELGERALLLPSLLARALAANDEAKYLLSLLQAARSHAELPSQPWSSLRDERLAARVPDPGLDAVVERSRQVGPDLYFIPGVAEVHRQLIRAVGDMLTPLQVAPAGDGDHPSVDPARLDRLLRAAPAFPADQVPGRYIDETTSARRESGDSLHLLVMDAHRALNRLESEVATESVDGAAAYALAGGDRELVAAFMAGLRETAPLKFDHPGLGTSATRVGDRLVIQNDLGTTQAHVVVVTVEGLAVTITYSDVHRRRLAFFASLFDRFPVTWSHSEAHSASPSLGAYHLTRGSYQASDRTGVEAFLRHAGSRLVFVLDWNRARKRLTTFLSNRDAIDVLRWAAEQNVGHMAFLTLGGDRLIYDAVELSAKLPARYGEPLIEVLGRDATLAVTRFALRSAAVGLLTGKSPLLIRDELRVEVLRHVQAVQRRLLDTSAEHASLVVECAQVLHAALVRLAASDGQAFLHRAARRASGWEHRADEILTEQRQAGRRVEGAGAITALTALADDAIDALEEAVFLLTLLPHDAVGVIRPILDTVAATAVMAAREYLKAVEIAREIVEGAAPEDLEDFLIAVDRVATLEHEADIADRTARAALVNEAPEYRSLYVADNVSRGVEDATDALLRSSLGLRDHILSALSVK
jgi:uncharacterized protein Yka (UPF0111/DUF47 family)